MAMLIKNQILKHLSKFAKNLSPDKLHVSTLKGHGELNNLELNEKVLTELLELPAWLRLTRATCNCVTVKIHWTKLKSVPIYLNLDEVIVEIETCEDLRPPTPIPKEHSYNSGGKYGFSDRVVDGMTVFVNSVVINFNSPEFQASFQLSRVVLESFSPDWKKKDVRLSRIKDVDSGELLLFKRLEWSMLRIEAKSKDSSANGIKRDIPLTPLRLITNQGCCKITIKKKLSDCSVVGSRLVFVFDDLLWVLTDAQLVAALHFVQSLSGLVKKATELEQKQKAKKKLEQQPEKDRPNKPGQHYSPIFHRHNVIETSYHVFCSRIDLHLCDDMDPKDGRSQHPNLRDGGALQVSLHKLVVDYYPYHRASSSREHWLRYVEPSSSHRTWLHQLLSLFQEKCAARGYTESENVRHSSVKVSISKDGNLTSTSPSSPDEHSSSRKTSVSSDVEGHYRNRRLSLHPNYRYLMSSCFVLRLEDIVAYKVSISTATAAKKQAIQKFIIYNKSVHIPSEIKTIHLEYVTYYLPGDLDYPVPSPNAYLHLGPLKIYLDTATILWLNAFTLNLKKCLMSLKLDTSETPCFTNFRIEALMPQVIIPCDQTSPTEPDRPKTLQVQASRIIGTNCRVGDHVSKASLKDCLNLLSNCHTLYKAKKFPWDPADKKPISDIFWTHSCETQPSSATSSPKKIISERTDIWSIHLDPFWAEFTICESGHTRLQSFVDPLPITLWVYKADSCITPEISVCKDNATKNMYLHGLKSHNDPNSITPNLNKVIGDNSLKKSDETDVYLLAHIHSILNIQLTHFQYLFVLRAVDIIIDLMEHLETDTATILKDKTVESVCVSTWLPKVEVSLILRNLNQLSATSESVDLASLQEDGSSNSDAPKKHKLLKSHQSSFSEDKDGPVSTTVTSPEKSCGGILDDCLENGVTKSCSDSLLNCHSAHSTPSTPVLSTSQLPVEEHSPYKGLQSGTNAMKRGFCSLVASIDSAFAKSESHSAADSDSVSYLEDDTLSIKSDLSSDLDQFVILNPENALDEEFFSRPPVEIAEEVKEDCSNISNYTLNSEKKKEMISVTTIICSETAFVIQSQFATSMMLQCNHIESKEEAAISWENFQRYFSTRSRFWKQEKKNISSHQSELCVRITENAPPDGSKNKSAQKFLTMAAQDLNLTFFMSSISALVEFFEDEVSSNPTPSKVVISNLKIQLQDEETNLNVCSEKIPLNISLPGCLLERTLKGTLTILPLPDGYVHQNAHLLLEGQHSDESIVLNKCKQPDKESKVENYQCKCNLNTSSPSSAEAFSHPPLQSTRKKDYEAIPVQTAHPVSTPLVLKLLKEKDDLAVKVKSLETEKEQLKEELQELKSFLRKQDLGAHLLECKEEITRLKNENKTLSILQYNNDGPLVDDFEFKK